jgi:hypothetical protein
VATTFHVVKIQKKQKTPMAFTIRAINTCKINYFFTGLSGATAPGIVGAVLLAGADF